MQQKIFQIKGGANIQISLKNLLADIESGKLTPTTCTLVVDSEIYHFGDTNDQQAVTNAFWNLSFAANRIMQKACSMFT